MRPPRKRPKPGAAALVVGVMLLATTASAQVETPAARADRLFKEGKAALEANRFAEACPKLAESQRLDPGTGTLLALALCHEANGQTATAWREFKDVVTASQRGRADRAALASQHIHAIEPALSTVNLAVPDELRTTVRIRIDGEEVPVLTWSSPIPLDPGDHVVEASAPGMAPWKTSVHLGGSAESRTVTVPRLDRSGQPVAGATATPRGAAPSVPTPEATPMMRRQKIALGIGGASLLSIVVGAAFGGVALSENSSAKRLCPTSPCSVSTGVDDNSTAQADAWVANVFIGLGLVGGGAATYLFLTHDSAPTPPPVARIVPVFGPGMGGLSLAGAW